MKTKSKTHQNGSFVIFEKHETSGIYQVLARRPGGALYDKVRCDTYADACCYWKAFNAAVRKL